MKNSFGDNLRSMIVERSKIFYEDVFETNRCWRKMTDLICSHIDEAVDFLLNDCTGEEYIWLSEIFLEITEGSRSHAFVNAIRSLLDKYPAESRKANVADFVEEAEGVLEYLDWLDGKKS